MMRMTRRWSYYFWGGLLGTTLLAGCASVAKNEPAASVPASPSQTSSSSPSVAPLSVASGDELEPGAGATNTSERERAAVQRVTMKRFKPVDWSTKTISQGASDTTSTAVSNAMPAVGALPAPTAFGERRASEALDRLGGAFTVRHEKRGSVITLPSDRLVDSGESALTASGQYSLRELAAGLRDQEGRTIRIQGYTDSMGTAAVNDALSLRRAEAVRDFLIAQGVAAESMRAEGLGAKRPVAQNGTSDGRAQNRRIEIVISP